MERTVGLLVALAILFAGVVVIMWVAEHSQNAIDYNRHMCRVYGYKVDCRTPLDPGQELQ